MIVNSRWCSSAYAPEPLSRRAACAACAPLPIPTNKNYHNSPHRPAPGQARISRNPEVCGVCSLLLCPVPIPIIKTITTQHTAPPGARRRTARSPHQPRASSPSPPPPPIQYISHVSSISQSRSAPASSLEAEADLD